LKPLVDDEQLNSWEMSFVKNIITLIETDSPISSAQETKLRQIHEDNVE